MFRTTPLPFSHKCATCMLAMGLAYAYVGMTHAQFTVSTPYEYPVKPGTPAWTQLPGIHQQLQACDIPQHIVSNMTTDALVRTCLNYPLRGNVALSSVSEAHGLKFLEHRFSGLRELFSRKDAGNALLSQYEQICTTALETSRPPNIIDHSFIVTILRRDEVLDQLSDQQLYSLLNASLQIARITREQFGPSASEGSALRLATKLIVTRGVTVELATGRFDKTLLDPEESAHFLNPSHDYMPESPFLDKLINLADEMRRD